METRELTEDIKSKIRAKITSIVDQMNAPQYIKKMFREIKLKEFKQRYIDFEMNEEDFE